MTTKSVKGFCPGADPKATLASRTRDSISRILDSIVDAARYCIGYGQESDRSSERRVVISGLGWRAQCSERDREREKSAEDMAAPEGEREARKRRERRDSGCAHERKERRPLSEERPPPPPPPPALHDHNRLESERRAERLSRARRPQFGGKRRRPTPRIQKHPKENDCFTTSEESRCSTPPHFEYVVVQNARMCEEPEILDVGSLHRMVGRTSSVSSNGEDETPTSLCAAAERARSDERYAPTVKRHDQPCPDRKLDKIQKKITMLKKNISKYESEFEAKHGHPLRPCDRIIDVSLTRMYENLRRYQEEKRSIRTDPVEFALKAQAIKQQKERDDKLDASFRSCKSMTEIVTAIEEWLESARQADGRTAIPESNWSSTQFAAEKLAVQKALLKLEASRGRPPAHSEDRGAARHLYERYRAMKRILANSRMDAITNGELATIHEHETMLFNTSVDSSSDSQEKPSVPSEISQEIVETPLQSPPIREATVGEEVPSSASSAPSEEVPPSNEALHCLGIDDLTKALTEAKHQKSILRRTLKDYEICFEQQNCRKVQRDDKKGHEEEYLRYKAVKARIKLITALINKQKNHKNTN
ncbi:unnamed protein product [Arctia plantaginis]|uniref:FAM13A-like domain-containing protein n=1 Tax=Arctia plantaginis TaxID=874455 RepID=A0A8S1A9Y4_ARCPL|nr:unnamed protein product [Arctia plantaginis]